jgi:hypothetical protein
MMKRSMLQTVLLLAATFAASSSSAEDWEVTGFIGLDTQAFWLDGQYQGQDNGVNPSLLLQPEFYWRSDDSQQRISIVGFARADSADDERSHADLREAYWGIEGSGWDLTAGVSKIFWGVTESRHLVDVINQTDLVESIDEESKLGQPLVNLNLQRDYGRFGVFVMPYFRERTFAGVDGRFRAPLVVDTDNPIYESSDEENHIDLALRYSHYIGDVDIGAHVFDGTSREAQFVVAPEGDRLLPVYDQMTQFGVDVQYTAEAWLWKLEAIARDTRADSFMAAVGGFEYTFYGVNDSSADVGVLIEYLYDDRNGLSPPSAADNDLFFGTRLALNDSDDTSVLAGVAVDLDTQEMFLNVEAERRFGDKLSVELQLRTFMNAEPGDALFAIEHDDYLQLRLSWYY